MKDITENVEKAKSMYAVCHLHSNKIFQVTKFHRPNKDIIEGTNSRHRTYDSERFQALHFPCAHAIVASSSVHLDCMSYVDEVYKLKRIYKM